VAGVVYGRAKGIPILAAVPVIAAFLVQYSCYLATGFATVREQLAGPRLTPFLVASAVLPYLICCCGPIEFQWMSLVRLAAMALALALWYVVLPRMAAVDLAFLGFVAAVQISKYFDSVYPVFYKEKLAILGHIGLFQIAILVLMLQRRVPETGFGFLPQRSELRTGALYYLYFIAAAIPLNLMVKATHFAPRPLLTAVGVAVVEFFGFLWFAGLCEEFFFRGVLQQWMEDWTSNRTAALVITSILFGLLHYWFRGWQWVPLATALGLICGFARNRTGNIRAGVVTHALVVATWRALLS
jgi:membrane protease YdiL (CAAX protease family)